MKCSSTRTRERLLERVGRQEGRAEARSRGHVNIAGLRASHRARRRARRGAYFSRIPLDLSHFSSRFFKNSIYRPSLSLSLWCRVAGARATKNPTIIRRVIASR